MLGKIGFEKLRISCVIGTEPEERLKEQEILVDLRATLDFSQSAQSDHLEDTVSYVMLAEVCTELAKKNQYHLLETYAAEVLQILLGQFPLEEVWIRIKKPQALDTADCCMVELSCRGR